MDDGQDMLDAVRALLRPTTRAGGATPPPSGDDGWPCAVLLDSHMPRLGGAEALRLSSSALLASSSSSGRPGGLVVIGATGAGPGSRESEELMSAGARCVIGKPILPAELAEALVREAGVELPDKVGEMALGRRA